MATILDLLMALNRDELPPIPAPASPVPMAPAPTGNVPEFGGPSQVTEPPQAPLDTRIIQQMLALRGPAPTPPEPASRGMQIARALMGYGAGMEGRGGEFLRQLQEPQRQYQRQLENYNQQGTELGVRGLETAQRRQERQTARAQQVSDREFAAEVNRESRRLRLSDDQSKERLRQAFQLERDARAARLQETRELQRERREREADAKVRTGRFFTLSKNMALSTELGRYYAGLSDKPLSPAAAKLDARLQQVGEVRMARGVGGGGGRGTSNAAVKAKDNFEAAKQAVISAVARGDVRTERLLRRKLDAAVGQLARYPGQIEFGGGEWPWAKLIGQQPQTQPGQAPKPAPDPLGVR